MVFSGLLIQKWLKSIKIDRFQLKLDRILIDIAIVDSISLLKSKSDQNWQSKPAGLKSESSTIWFGTPNRISLEGCCSFTRCKPDPFCDSSQISIGPRSKNCQGQSCG